MQQNANCIITPPMDQHYHQGFVRLVCQAIMNLLANLQPVVVCLAKLNTTSISSVTSDGQSGDVQAVSTALVGQIRCCKLLLISAP